MTSLKKMFKYIINKFFDSKFKIGNYTITVPPNYALPRYQEKFKLYDRFLPILVKHIDSTGSIIDVGANIGDTTIALVQNCNNTFFSIEPSSFFFQYLEKNIDLLDKSTKNRIKLLKKLIGTGNINGVLDHTSKGTASINISTVTSNNEFIKLDDLIVNQLKIDLLKVDTDGFDFDVILSAKNLIQNSHPIIFWENEIIDTMQIDGFQKLYKFLIEKGYTNIIIFDNYGNIISEDNDFQTLTNINSYLLSMRKYNCTRTFYYVDVLAWTEKDNKTIENTKNNYNRLIIEN